MTFQNTYANIYKNTKVNIHPPTNFDMNLSIDYIIEDNNIAQPISLTNTILLKNKGKTKIIAKQNGLIESAYLIVF